MLGDYSSKLSTQDSLLFCLPWVGWFRGASHLGTAGKEPPNIQHKEEFDGMTSKLVPAKDWNYSLRRISINLRKKEQSFLFHSSRFTCKTEDRKETFWNNFSIGKKLVDYPLRSTVPCTNKGIYLLILFIWNNLDELNLLITDQTTSAKSALTTAFFLVSYYCIYFYLNNNNSFWSIIDWKVTSYCF